jgi:hypothetical protein
MLKVVSRCFFRVLTNWEPRTRFPKSRKVVFPSKTLLLPSTPILPSPPSNNLNSLLWSICVPRCNQSLCNIHIDTHKQQHPPSSCPHQPHHLLQVHEITSPSCTFTSAVCIPPSVYQSTSSSVSQTDARSAYSSTRSRLESRVCVMASMPNTSMQQQSHKKLSLVSTKVLRQSNLTIL